MNAPLEPAGHSSKPQVFFKGLQISMVNVKFLIESSRTSSQPTECGPFRGSKLKDFPLTRTFEQSIDRAVANVGRRMITDVRNLGLNWQNCIAKVPKPRAWEGSRE